MSAIYVNPGEVRWVVRDDGSVMLQQMWEKCSAPEKGVPRIQNVWRNVKMPDGYVLAYAKPAPPALMTVAGGNALEAAIASATPTEGVSE